MNLPRARIDHGDILAFIMRQGFITVVVAPWITIYG